MNKSVNWGGVFPAVTTQFTPDFKVDLDATRRIVKSLLAEGVDGIIACGTVGENTVLSPQEKRETVAAIHDAAGGKVPVLSGVAEITTEQAIAYTRDMKKLGVDGLMLMPPMIYNGTRSEIIGWFKTVSASTDLPIMLYNNPPAYRNDVTPDMAAEMVSFDTIVAIKESAGDTRRFVDLANMVDGRFLLFCGLDDVVLESLALGAVGWVSGLSNVFARECGKLFELGTTGQTAEALSLYRWFMPLLHLDARGDLVQCIKLCEEIMGRGSSRTRPPRLALEGAARGEIEQIMRTALAHRPNV
jgi:4-hydroxy-tetrahydrodipicolinate synthase